MRYNKAIIIILILFADITGDAQTLTCAYNCPQVGEIFSVSSVSPVLHSSGLNQLWNFTKLSDMDPGTFLVKYVAPASISASSLYPQSNVARQIEQQYTFFETGSSGVKFAAKATATAGIQSFELPLPFAFGNTYT